LPVYDNNTNLRSQPVYQDQVDGVGDNLVSDPSDPNKFYYCREQNPVGITMATRDEKGAWTQQVRRFPKTFAGRKGVIFQSLRNLGIDPSGKFFVCNVQIGDASAPILVFLEKETLADVPTGGDLHEVYLGFNALEHLTTYAPPGAQKNGNKGDIKAMKRISTKYTALCMING